MPELVERSGKSRATVYRRLKQLLQVGLAERVEGGYRARAGDLNHAAHQLGTDGAGARQRARHATERRQYRQGYRDELARRRTLRAERLAAARAARHALLQPARGRVATERPAGGARATRRGPRRRRISQVRDVGDPP